MDEKVPVATRRARSAVGLDLAMVALAMVSIALLAWEQYASLAPQSQRLLLFLDIAIVAVFWFEYAWRWSRSPGKWAFVRANWYELPGMIPILPGMERYGTIRLFRLLRILRILRLVGALRRFEPIERAMDRYVRRNKMGYVALLALGVVAVCATLAWLLEPQTFPTMGDALWWAIVTATTVGYGDFVPLTDAGRLIGVVLMLLGVGIIGTLAATLSSFLVERRFDEERKAAPGPPPAAAPPALPLPGLGLAAELERLARLRERGELSEPEFAEAKRRLLR